MTTPLPLPPDWGGISGRLSSYDVRTVTARTVKEWDDLHPRSRFGIEEPGLEDQTLNIIVALQVGKIVLSEARALLAAAFGIAAGAEEAGPLITFGHGARHLAESGLTAEIVEKAIRTQITDLVKDASATGNFWGIVEVEGTKIMYRAFTVLEGTMINIGTYYVSPN